MGKSPFRLAGFAFGLRYDTRMLRVQVFCQKPAQSGRVKVISGSDIVPDTVTIGPSPRHSDPPLRLMAVVTPGAMALLLSACHVILHFANHYSRRYG